jgi:hypothetical protein
MNRSVLRLVPVVSMLGLMVVACGSGEVAGDTEGVLGMREGGRGVTFTSGGLEELCARALECAPAEAPVASVDACVDLMGPLLDDLLAGASPACAAAFEDVLACTGAVAECVEGELVASASACADEEARAASACEGWEPNLDLDLGSYVETDTTLETVPTGDSTEG